MTLDASLQQNTLAEAHAHRPIWSALTNWWSPAAATQEADLGYECALPWTLGVDTPTDGRASPY